MLKCMVVLLVMAASIAAQQQPAPPARPNPSPIPEDMSKAADDLIKKIGDAVKNAIGGNISAVLAGAVVYAVTRNPMVTAATIGVAMFLLKQDRLQPSWPFLALTAIAYRKSGLSAISLVALAVFCVAYATKSNLITV